MNQPIKKVRINLYDIKFLGKYLSFEEACQVLWLVYGWDLKTILAKKATTIESLISRLEKSDKLTADKMLLIHRFIENQDEKYNFGFIRRVFGRLWRKIY